MFLKGMKNKQFFLAILIILTSMIFSVSAFIEEGMEYFFNHDYIVAFLQGYNGDRSLLIVLAPLIATIPFASQHIENRKSGTMKYIVSRMGYKQYFNSIFIINGFISFTTFIFGMLLFLIMSILFFNRSINMDAYYAITKVSIYESAVRTSPLFYVVIIILTTIGSLFAMFLGLTKIEPMAIFDVSRVKGISVIFVFVYLILIVVISYWISYKKFKRDIETDE